MPPKRNGRPPARATAAKAASHTRASSALGAPPSTSVDLEDAEDAEELQEILAEAAARPAVGTHWRLLKPPASQPAAVRRGSSGSGK